MQNVNSGHISRKVFLTGAFSMMLVASAALVTFSVSFANAQTAIHDAMEDQIGPAFKVIVTDLKAGVITSKTQLAGKTMLAGFISIQDQIPTEVPNADGSTHSPTPEELVTFKQINADMLALVQVLVPQLNANDVAGAQKTLQQMAELRKKAHEQFKPEKH